MRQELKNIINGNKTKNIKIILNQTGLKLPSHFLQKLVFIHMGFYMVKFLVTIFLKSLEKIILLERLSTN